MSKTFKKNKFNDRKDKVEKKDKSSKYKFYFRLDNDGDNMDELLEEKNKFDQSNIENESE